MQRPATATEARTLLHATQRDAVPRTRDGDAIDVLHQLPPLSETALAEAGGRDTAPLATAPPVTTPIATAPLATAPPSRPRRHALLLTGAALVLAAGIAVPVAIAATGGGADGPTPRPTSTPTRTTGGTYTAPAVSVDEICTFTDEGDLRRTADKIRVRCTRQSDGGYVWERA